LRGVNKKTPKGTGSRKGGGGRQLPQKKGGIVPDWEVLEGKARGVKCKGGSPMGEKEKSLNIRKKALSRSKTLR